VCHPYCSKYIRVGSGGGGVNKFTIFIFWCKTLCNHVNAQKIVIKIDANLNLIIAQNNSRSNIARVMCGVRGMKCEINAAWAKINATYSAHKKREQQQQQYCYLLCVVSPKEVKKQWSDFQPLLCV
jgi:hypothetical protein